MGVVRASPIWVSRSRSPRPNVLRSAGVMSKKMRPPASLKKPGPLEGSSGGRPKSVSSAEPSSRNAWIPIGVSGR
jgi:hypothetical protein